MDVCEGGEIIPNVIARRLNPTPIITPSSITRVRAQPTLPSPKTLFPSANTTAPFVEETQLSGFPNVLLLKEIDVTTPDGLVEWSRLPYMVSLELVFNLALESKLK
mmetsp:Transcript_15619/g.32974  ORF Transcript_15619/g.32974 Transcript_15619/m.32974 type:complete len:106 (+) Transcript_15619:622-939(+)